MQLYEHQFRCIAANMVDLMAVCMGRGMAKGMQKGKDVKQGLEQDDERDPEQVENNAAGDDAEWCMELARKNTWTQQFRCIAALMVHLMAVCMGKGLPTITSAELGRT